MFSFFLFVKSETIPYRLIKTCTMPSKSDVSQECCHFGFSTAMDNSSETPMDLQPRYQEPTEEVFEVETLGGWPLRRMFGARPAVSAPSSSLGSGSLWGDFLPGPQSVSYAQALLRPAPARQTGHEGSDSGLTGLIHLTANIEIYPGTAAIFCSKQPAKDRLGLLKPLLAGVMFEKVGLVKKVQVKNRTIYMCCVRDQAEDAALPSVVEYVIKTLGIRLRVDNVAAIGVTKRNLQVRSFNREWFESLIRIELNSVKTIFLVSKGSTDCRNCCEVFLTNFH